MKKGIIAISIIAAMICAVLAFVLLSQDVLSAPSPQGRSICLERWIGQAEISNPYLIILIYQGTYAGKVVSATGEIANDTEYIDACIQGVADSVSGETVYDMPPLTTKYEYRVLLKSQAGLEPAKTDIAYDAGFYDPATGRVHGNYAPVELNRVKVNNY